MTDTVAIIAACRYAAEKHANQRRKNADKTPYINHPLEVADFLTTHGVTDCDTIIGAVLHDVIEDTDGTPDEIQNMFGENVLSIVLEVSDDKSLNKIERKRIQITHAKSISDSAKLVKLADKYSNISGLLTDPPTSWSDEIIKGYVYWGMAVCRNLYGVDTDIDSALQQLFKQFDIDVDMSDKELMTNVEQYYKFIYCWSCLSSL